jgi:hypothetical protein
MDGWFESICAEPDHLAPDAAHALDTKGFAVIPGPFPPEAIPGLADAYDQAVRLADTTDIAVGGSTTRVSDFVNRDPEFDHLYLFRPLLTACCRVIQQPFKLSTLLARTLRPRSAAQRVHVDFAGHEQAWPMVGFILMLDEFRRENGATCFLPGSQGAPAPPEEAPVVPACGPPGSLIVYNGSVWHGHGANETDTPRRSLQGAFIRRTEKSGGDWPARMARRTLERIAPLAKYLLELDATGESDERETPLGEAAQRQAGDSDRPVPAVRWRRRGQPTERPSGATSRGPDRGR